MDRARLFRGVAILVAVLTVATVAGGFTPASGGDGDGERSPGFGFGEGTGAGFGQGDDVGFQQPDSAETHPLPTWLITGPLTVILWASMVFFVVFVVHTIWRGRLDDLIAVIRRAAVDFLAATVFLLGLVAFLLLLNNLFGGGGGGALGGGTTAGPTVSGGESAVTVPSTSLIGGLAVILGLLGAFGAAVALGRETADDESGTGPSTGGGPVTRVPTEGLVGSPGAATDVEPTNEVYQAWIAMRDRIGKPVPKSETPGSVRRRAVDAGVDGEAAAELTALFCLVRYGGAPVTEDRERRAAELRSRLDDSQS